MDLRPLSSFDRHKTLEQELGLDLSALSIDPAKLGHADERNCEQMFGHVPIPVGYAGPLPVTFSSGETADIHLPLATTEGALVASVNRGCKALRLCGGVKTESVYHGVSRSIGMKIRNPKSPFEGLSPSPRARASEPRAGPNGEIRNKSEYLKSEIRKHENRWKIIGEATSNHLKILKYDIDAKDDYIFFTIYADTDEAMGMNMVTIAAEAIGKWLAENLDLELITVAANVDSDKKPSRRTHDRGRGYEVTATATVPEDVIRAVLKTTPDALLEVAHAKLDYGSELTGAIGRNCHAANIIAALYLATGQDPAHVVEGSLADTIVTRYSLLVTRQNKQERAGQPTSNELPDSIIISTHLPSLMVGIRGGGTTLPAQSQCLHLLLHPPGPRTQDLGPHLHPCRRLAESIGAAVLAGELSLLAALASSHLGKSHAVLARAEKT